MTTQLDLLKPAAPPVDCEDVAFLVNCLRGHGWQTADVIAWRPEWLARFGETRSADRRVRAIASASRGVILSYPGSPGYRLTSEATLEEIQTATAKLRHQANEMTARAMQIDRVRHGGRV